MVRVEREIVDREREREREKERKRESVCMRERKREPVRAESKCQREGARLEEVCVPAVD